MIIPLNPFESFVPEKWNDIENKLNIIFPKDYKTLISAYGTGQFFKFISFFNPFAKNKNVNLLDQLALVVDQYYDLKEGGEVINYSFFPVKGGLFPIGGTDNGDKIFYLTEGHVEKWKIVVNEARGEEWEEFDMSVSQFLGGIIDGGVVCNVFPNLPMHPPLFSSG